MSLEKLLELAPPVYPLFHPMDPEQWRIVEQSLGLTFPEDYKILVNTYGSGYFGNHIALRNPLDYKYGLLNNITQLRPIYERFREENLEYSSPFPLWPAERGLFPWGRDDNQSLLCWLMEGSPDTWRTIVLDSYWSQCYTEYAMTATEFLVAWLTGQVFPPSWGEETYPFHAPLFRHEIDYTLIDLNYERHQRNVEEEFRRRLALLPRVTKEDSPRSL